MKLFQIGGRRGNTRPPKKKEGPFRVFVTGATGYIGRAVVKEMVEAGHEVAGLTRWAENTLMLKELGARAVVGDLKDTGTFRSVAAEYDVLIHLAAEPSADNVVADRGAVEALLWAARQDEDRHEEDPPRAVIYTSGCFVLGDTGDEGADEEASTDGAAEVVAWRPAHERRILDANDETVATAVIRPGMVYGGRRGLISDFFATAEEEGAARIVGDGDNRWSPVHVADVARLYRMVAEERARGIFHCAEDAVPVHTLARAASEAAGRDGAVRSVPLDEAQREMGGLADALVLDQVVRCPRARELGWRPSHPPFLESVDEVYREWTEGG